MGRAPCCDKASVKRGPWSPEEDAVLKGYIEKHGTGGNWIALPRKAGLNRCGKSCRLRWLNYLRPDIKHGGFTEEEDAVICNLYCKLGSRWSVIASHLSGRTDNDVKNYWNTKLKKKLMAREKKAPSISSSCSSPFGGSKLTPPDYSINKFCLQPSPFVSPSQQLSATWSSATVDDRSSISCKSWSEADDDLLLSESEFGLLSDILGGYLCV